MCQVTVSGVRGQVLVNLATRRRGGSDRRSPILVPLNPNRFDPTLCVGSGNEKGFRMKHSVVVTVMGLVVVGSMSWWAFADHNSPHRALLDIRFAAREGDPEALASLVDVDTLEHQLLEAMANRATAERYPSGVAPFWSSFADSLSDPEAAARFHDRFASSMDVMLQQRGLSRASLEEFACDTANVLADSVPIGLQVLSWAGLEPGNIRRVSAVHVEGDQAIAEVEIEQMPFDTTISVSVELDRTADGDWRVTGFSDLDSYLASVGAWREAVLRKYDVALQAVVDSMFRVGDVLIERPTPIMDLYYLYIPVTNTSSDTVTWASFSIAPETTQDRVYGRAMLIGDTLAPGETVVLQEPVMDGVNEEDYVDAIRGQLDAIARNGDPSWSVSVRPTWINLTLDGQHATLSRHPTWLGYLSFAVSVACPVRTRQAAERFFVAGVPRN